MILFQKKYGTKFVDLLWLICGEKMTLDIEPVVDQKLKTMLTDWNRCGNNAVNNIEFNQI